MGAKLRSKPLDDCDFIGPNMDVGFHAATANNSKRPEHHIAIRVCRGDARKNDVGGFRHLRGRSGDFGPTSKPRGFTDSSVVNDDILAALNKTFGYRVANRAKPNDPTTDRPFAISFGLQPLCQTNQIAPVVICRCSANLYCVYILPAGFDRTTRFGVRVARPD